MDYNKIRSFCRVFRIAIGLALIAAAYFIGDTWEYSQWLYLGALPLVAGAINFCPLCLISKKCDLPQNNEPSNESN